MPLIYDNMKAVDERSINENPKERLIILNYPSNGHGTSMLPKANCTNLRQHIFCYTAVILMLVTALARGQGRMVTGSVTDEKHAALPGVNILIKGTTIGTVTDLDGNYSLSVQGDSTLLTFSFIGYETAETAIGSRSIVNLTLAPSVNYLSEVIVIGYGTQEKKDVTGSMAVVKSKELNATPASNIENNFQGRMAGVTVISSGQPGVGAQVVIRGASTFAGSTQPLYVVDGVPTLDISTINPADVESATALKDAGAASIYGSRASNGVILITTKQGESGTMKLTYNGYYGVQFPGEGITNILDTQGYADLTWLAYKNSGLTPPSTMYGTGQEPIIPDYYRPAGKLEGAVNEATYDKISNPITRTNKSGTDWYDELTQTAPIQNHDLAVSGGSNNSRYYVGLNYMNQEGIVVYTGAERYSMRINTEFKVNEKIRIGENITNTFRSNSLISSENVSFNGATSLVDVYLTPVILPVYDVGQNFTFATQPTALNPYAIQYRSKDNKSYSLRTFGNIYAEIDFLKDFTFRTAFGGSFQYGRSYAFTPEAGNTLNSFTEGSYDEADWNWQNILTYRKNLNAHSFSVLAGLETIKSDMGRISGGTRKDYLVEDPNNWTLNGGNATGQTNYGTSKTPYSLVSFFGRVDYGFRGRYLLNLTIRRDGSSKFINHKYGTFPAATIAWRLSEESFMQGISFLSDLKIRAGYGVMGDQINASATNSYTSFLSDPGGSYYDITGSNNSAAVGFGKAFTGNPDGQWQENKTANLGVDFSLFRAKLYGSVDIYKKVTDRLLFTAESPGTNGTSLPAAKNVGKMENKGIDLMINYRSGIGQNWTFESTLTFTTYKNKIVKIADNLSFYLPPGNTLGIRNAVGQPVSSFYGYEAVGIWQSQQQINSSYIQKDAKPGRTRYADADGDGTVTENDRVFIGNPNPDFTAGINLSLSYKNVDLSAFFYAVYGNEIYNFNKWDREVFARGEGAKSRDLLENSWTEERPNASIPIAEVGYNFTNDEINSNFVEDGSYLRLRNIQLGYNLPTDILQKAGMKKARMYLQAINLITLTKYSGLEPEVGGTSVAFGIGGSDYPTTRQFIVGLNLEF